MRQGICFVGVEAGRDKDKLGPELLHLLLDTFQDFDVLFLPCAYRHWEVPGKSFPLTISRFRILPRAGIAEGRILVETDEIYSWILVEHVLGAVAVMDIPIYYENSFNGVLFLKVSCRDGHIVKKTKSHGPVAFCVVAGRPYRTKAVSHRALYHVVYSFQHPTDSAQGNFKSCGTQDAFWGVQKSLGSMRVIPCCCNLFASGNLPLAGRDPMEALDALERFMRA